MASQIIEKLLQDSQIPTLYFYCKHGLSSKNNFQAILRALLCQLALKDTLTASYLYDMCCTRDQASVFAIIAELAETMLDSQTKIYIVLDGLDECQHEEVPKVLSWFLAYLRNHTTSDPGRLRLLFVGQRTDTIQNMLSEASWISLENPGHQEDVQRYVAQQAAGLRNEFGIKVDAEHAIVRRVSEAAKGRYQHYSAAASA